MSQDDAEYPFPNYISPLKGVTDIKMVQYWLKHGILDKELRYNRQYTHGHIDSSLLHQHAETVDILFATYGRDYELGGEYTPQVCHTLTFDDMMQLYQFSRRYYFKFTSFNYKLPNGDIYYRIIELLKNITEDEIDTYIEKYSKECPPISILLSTLPYERSKQLVDSIQSIHQDYFTSALYEDYLICSTSFNTFNPDIQSIFTKANPKLQFFGPVVQYSPPAMQYMIDGDPRFPVKDWDYEIRTCQLEVSKQCLDMILASNKCSNLFDLLIKYIQLDDTDTVKSLLKDNNTLNVSIIGNEMVLCYVQSAEMVHLLVSHNASLNRSSNLGKAARYSSLDVVKALLYHKVSLECDEDGRHPLHDLGSASPDIVKFLTPFFSSSTSDISMHVKSNNTTGLPDDVYNYIKSSLSKIDVHICGKRGNTPFHHALRYGIHVPYLLENNASPHLYIRNGKHEWKVFDTYDDALYCHYIDHTLIKDGYQSRLLIYHNTYNLMKYKAYPLTYVTSYVNNTATTDIVYYSHLTLGIVDRHRDFITLILRYLSPVNMPFKSYRDAHTPAMYPLETALRGDSPNKDIVYELLQFGAVYNKSDHLKYQYNRLIKTLLIDQCFLINDE